MTEAPFPHLLLLCSLPPPSLVIPGQSSSQGSLLPGNLVDLGWHGVSTRRWPWRPRLRQDFDPVGGHDPLLAMQGAQVPAFQAGGLGVQQDHQVTLPEGEFIGALGSVVVEGSTQLGLEGARQRAGEGSVPLTHHSPLLANPTPRLQQRKLHSTHHRYTPKSRGETGLFSPSAETRRKKEPWRIRPGPASYRGSW